jgi:peptide deformylase
MKQTTPPIITLPHSDLRRSSEDARPEDASTKDLIAAMEAATLEWERHRPHEIAVALAAVQIGVLKKVIVVRHSFKDRSDQRFDVFLNPRITRYEGVPEIEMEGCLSVKDMYIEVKRYPKIKVRAQTPEGVSVKFIAKGFLARVIQHEVDHTHGLVTVDRADEESVFYQMDSKGHMVPLTPVERASFLDNIGGQKPPELVP